MGNRFNRLRHIYSAYDLGASERYCECCGARLIRKFAYLELDQRTNTFHDDGKVPPEKSQGWFPFGLTCAERELARHRHVTQEKGEVRS